MIFRIEDGQAISTRATSHLPSKFSCCGSNVVKWDSLLSGNVFMDALETKLIVNSCDIIFWGSIWQDLLPQLNYIFVGLGKGFFEACQFRFVEFALDQLVVGVFNGISGRVQRLYRGYFENFFCKLNAITAMKSFYFAFNSHKLPALELGIAHWITALKRNKSKERHFYVSL